MRSLCGMLFVFCLGSVHPAAGALLEPEHIGHRSAVNFMTIPQRLTHEETYLRFRFPWSREWGGWRASTHLEVTSGLLRSRNQRVEMYSVGPSLQLKHRWLTLALGFPAPTYISEIELESRNLGGHLQFTSHLGLSLRVDDTLSLDLRLQHTSNGRIYSDNDGFDLQVIALTWRM